MSREEQHVLSVHGAGGELAGQLLARHVLTRFAGHRAGRIGLEALDDGATVALPPTGEIVLTTDSHVVKPIVFPGGDIGRLAAAGTINDLAVMGARPLALTLSLILEEGFPFATLDKLLDSFATVLEEVGAALITGDTKVMGPGEIDGIAINTAGIGVAAHAVSDADLRPGDRILATGTLGDHGMALIVAREGFRLESDLRSDVAPIWGLVERALAVGGIRAMKDPTRGGAAAALNEMARKSRKTIEIDGPSLPIRPEVRSLSEIVGISPLEVASEGRALLVVDPAAAAEVLGALRSHPLGEDACEIGRVSTSHPSKVIIATEVGGRRFLEMPLGDPVPRIC